MNDEHSYAQAACNGIADVGEAAIGATALTGSMLASGASSASSSMMAAGHAVKDGAIGYHDWAQGLSNPETGIRPYTRFRDGDENE